MRKTKVSFHKRGDGTLPEIITIIPLKDDVVFPHLILPLDLTGEGLVKAINDATIKNEFIGVVALKYGVDSPKPNDFYEVGTAVKVVQVLEATSDNVKVLIEGVMRIKVMDYVQTEPYYKARVEEIREFTEKSETIDVLVQSVITLFKLSAMLGKTLPKDLISMIDTVNNPSILADLAAIYLELPVNEKQKLLEMIDPQKRLRVVFHYLNKEVQLKEVRGKIDEEVAKEMSKTQREYFLREQLRAIQKELGQEDSHMEELNKLEDKIKEAKMPREVEDVAMKELERLRDINPASAEYPVSRTYLDYLINIPWNKKTIDNLEINQAERILNEDHYGLEKVKARILEFLAVHKLKEKLKGPILCFCGPPGTGKTSLGKSIARSLGRKFIRISLGGIRDEAEIRGHRRTYVGALPGRIMQEICRAGSSNPVFMLDEIDKIGADFRGDPASALLEVLDPEQNVSFVDHYLDVSFDLSHVLFITTANILDTVHTALRDRMEVIYLPGYSEDEKLKIAHQFLIPKQIKENGLENHPVIFQDQSIYKIIREYTREAGLRNLEREIGSICRKIAKEIVAGKQVTKEIAPEIVEKFLGPRKYFYQVADEEDRVGVVTGLAWTETGGDIIFVEASRMKGEKELTLTGQLGDVMQESAIAALSYVRSNAKRLAIDENFYDTSEIHIHVPSGAIPKDGPSAGITMCMALISLLTGRHARREVALTGEVTLTGNVLPIGGVKEKVLAAIRAGVKTIVLPLKNKDDYEEIDKEIRDKIRCVYIQKIDDAIDTVLIQRQ
ncbi:MAG: endopeptidase La [Candidatus Brocadia sp. AMX2]|uniref:Lon protease n=1 Tax=Candidatus Brocadia sinica JPN1 TaxID=1197129 RepID=A0ABQ0JVN6_9BACT|nr:MULTISPECIES: endopeptidase La [Brocadia]KXK30183.1 MAG: ATP-dependent protease La [Candidatus Brocadia sinica]MBC6930747.1 endopeptidase La [Candidatus Brocadia sp.]MBL1167715.1 endopeptidase La [Candidatus Brocadia sp. AMX1]NOG41328.1 endopeptidase La [Planctomycetota bacterium]KAA0245612.1 MAG: endopeptidase La [Candidatus Brocadia sp. AMX2]